MREYGLLRDRLAEFTATPTIDDVDRILYLQQRIVNEAARLAFRPRSDQWARLARSFGDGLTSAADELLVLAAQRPG